MKKLTTMLALMSTAVMVLPAAASFAATTDADIQADMNAIRKDNAALAKDRAALQRHRAAKAQAKANDEYGDQAAESTKIAADKAAIKEKKAERGTDRKILEHDEEETTEQQ